MMIPVELVLLLALFTAAVIGLLICIQSVYNEHRRAFRRLAKDVVRQIAGHALWTGAWLVAIDRTRAPHTQDMVRREAENQAPPQRVLDLWEGAGAELIGHVQGPPVTSEAEACGWVARASDELAKRPIAGLATGDRRVVFALVYACGEAPPPRPARLGDLRGSVLGPACIGAAFVACAEDPAATRASSGRVRLLGAAAWAFAVLSILTAVYTATVVFRGGGSPAETSTGDAGAPDMRGETQPATTSSAPRPARGAAPSGQGISGTPVPVFSAIGDTRSAPEPAVSGSAAAASDASSDAGAPSDAGSDAALSGKDSR